MEEDIRCGYVVPEKLKKIWKIQMDLALEVKRICEKYDIQYFIIWGTLLGAVRHGGYIPWDDDFDIAFLRKDYDKFCSIAKNEIKSPYFLQNNATDKGYYLPYSRLRNSKTTGIIYANIPFPYNNGVFVDLYPLDVLTANKMMRYLQFKLRDSFRLLCDKYYAKERGERYPRSLEIVRKFFSYEKICEWMDKIYKLGEIFGGNEVGLVYHPDLIKNYKFKKKYIGKVENIIFDNVYFSAPQFKEKILEQVYGDYMKLPPARKRGNWHEGQILYEPDIPFDDFIRKKKKNGYHWTEYMGRSIEKI
ncbi:LicD family protein [Oribacterium sp. NK2B42]|uniref:LicD family protein n=1 Tax=Oribacterium sp. NK2B42 TaxID=689781 RepID=UPI00041C517B|nr:LicD family protein [Oribacterium sp. NK2B42]